jgi:hypothetical protein
VVSFFSKNRLFDKYQTNSAEGTVSRKESRVDLKVRNNLALSAEAIRSRKKCDSFLPGARFNAVFRPSICQKICVICRDLKRGKAAWSIRLQGGEFFVQFLKRYFRSTGAQIGIAALGVIMLNRLLDRSHQSLNDRDCGYQRPGNDAECFVATNSRDQRATSAEQSDEAKHEIHTAVKPGIHVVESTPISNIQRGFVDGSVICSHCHVCHGLPSVLVGVSAADFCAAALDFCVRLGRVLGPWRLLEFGYFVVGKLIIARRNGAATLIHRLGVPA